MNILVFDIETIPDIASGRRLYELEGLNDADVAKVMFHKRREETGDSEFLRHHLHRIVAISGHRRADQIKIWTPAMKSDEADLIRRF
jgi:predicted PolB exonuclease-like 3'-5' exonuclease